MTSPPASLRAFPPGGDVACGRRKPGHGGRWPGLLRGHSTWLVAMAVALSGCAALRDAPRLAYQCPEDLRFEARLYEDMAVLDGQRGHAVLERLPHQRDDELIYGDATLTADFGLGLEQRLARLSYANIPEAVTCTRVVPAGQPAAPVRAAPRPGPRNPPPFDPDAPVQTNIRTGDGNVGPG